MEQNGLDGRLIDLPVDAVVYREDLYPRSATSHEKVAEYADTLEQLPPIEVNQHYILIDGWHRWMAHKKEGRETIRTRLTETSSERQLKFLAGSRNSQHGWMLAQEEKKKEICALYRETPLKERAAFKVELCLGYSVPERTLNRWLHRIDEDTEKETKEQAFKLWLACSTQEEIGDLCSVTQRTISNWIEAFRRNGHMAKMTRSLPDHSIDGDFRIPQTNVWNEKDPTPHSDFPGSTEPLWLDRLLYLYTQPFDIVVDPFAGSGSTIEVCKKRLRRYWVSDRKPLPERAHEIRGHDLTDGLPPLHNWRDVRLVYLDPPYWKQREGDYSQDPTDLANMPLEAFTDRLASTIRDFGKKLQSGASLALIIQPTHWHSPEHRYVDHVLDMVARVPLPVTMRIACPTGASRYTAYTDWVLAQHSLLVRNREIVVWTVP
jgi:hypothetical protein